MDFDLYTQIGKELQDFQQDKIHIAGTKQDDNNRYLKKKQTGYDFNQREMLELVDLYYTSHFESGNTDSEQQRKLFLNICAFRADVASKMIDIDTKNFVFIPDDGNKWGAFFITNRFRKWARENYFGELINDAVEYYPKYGTVVAKRVGKEIVRVPLKNLVNQQDAKSLRTATHVIEIHENMRLEDMKEFPDWNTDKLNLKYGETTTVYERYGTIPLTFYNKYLKKGTSKSDKDKVIDVVAICTITDTKGEKNRYTGSILYMEKCKKEDRPYEECHWKRQDGRWLGIGEVENQLENQIARNLVANLRRRALLWSSKKIFQSTDDTVAKNFIKDVKDGEVLRIMPNGQISQVDMASREVGEFQSTEQIWEENSNQKSFTYDAATGENPPSGTAFRLQVMVSNAVASHFGFKKQKLGFFFKRLVVEHVYEIFKRENSKAHTITMFGNEEGIQNLKKIGAEIEMNKRITDWALSDDNKPLMDFDTMRQLIEESYKEKTHLFVEVPDKFYDNIKANVELTITGEEIDVTAKITTYTNLYQTLVAKGDPRSEQVLSKIMDLTGDNLEAILGAEQPQAVPSANPVQSFSPPAATAPTTL